MSNNLPPNAHTRSIRGHSSFTNGRTEKTAWQSRVSFGVCVCVCVCVCVSRITVVSRAPPEWCTLAGPLEYYNTHTDTHAKKKVMNAHTLHVAEPKNVGVNVSKAVFFSHVCVCVVKYECVFVLLPAVSRCVHE